VFGTYIYIYIFSREPLTNGASSQTKTTTRFDCNTRSSIFVVLQSVLQPQTKTFGCRLSNNAKFVCPFCIFRGRRAAENYKTMTG
jgi:hypothetical protein